MGCFGEIKENERKNAAKQTIQQFIARWCVAGRDMSRRKVTGTTGLFPWARHERTLNLNETCGAELRSLVGALRSRLRDGAVGGNRLAPYLESVHE